MRIDVFSDTVCPWCFIGKRRLEQALAERRPSGLEIRWRAFQLNPGMPEGGMDRRSYLETKFGGASEAESIYQRVESAGREEGIAFAFDKIKTTPNTVMSHRLIRFARVKGMQDALVEAIFNAYFLQGCDIGDIEILTELAVNLGFDRAEVATFLAGDGERDAVLAEDNLARRSGINGVPCFLFNGRHALPGAQASEVFSRLFDVIAQEEATEAIRA